MLDEARAPTRAPERICIKVPFGDVGLGETHALTKRGVRTNAPRVMSFNQAYCGALAGGAYVSIFSGRIRDMASAATPVIERTRARLDRERLGAEIIVGSIRHFMDVNEALDAGAHIVTVLSRHPPEDAPQPEVPRRPSANSTSPGRSVLAKPRRERRARPRASKRGRRGRRGPTGRSRAAPLITGTPWSSVKPPAPAGGLRRAQARGRRRAVRLDAAAGARLDGAYAARIGRTKAAVERVLVRSPPIHRLAAGQVALDEDHRRRHQERSRPPGRPGAPLDRLPSGRPGWPPPTRAPLAYACSPWRRTAHHPPLPHRRLAGACLAFCWRLDYNSQASRTSRLLAFNGGIGSGVYPTG